MELDFASNHLAIKEVFTVGIALGGKLYLYPILSHSHFEALLAGMTEHRNAGHPLPPGTACYVDGPCHEPACDCGGKIRIIKYVVLPTTSGASRTLTS